MCRPVRIVSRKLRNVHLPRPVSGSGVRLAVKLTPQGPDHAVLVAAAVMTHGPAEGGGSGSSIFSGWPDSMRLMSGSGPAAPIFHGVWQSLQTEVITRYLPRATLPAASVALAASTKATPARAANAVAARRVLVRAGLDFSMVRAPGWFEVGCESSARSARAPGGRVPACRAAAS